LAISLAFSVNLLSGFGSKLRNLLKLANNFLRNTRPIIATRDVVQFTYFTRKSNCITIGGCAIEQDFFSNELRGVKSADLQVLVGVGIFFPDKTGTFSQDVNVFSCLTFLSDSLAFGKNKDFELIEDVIFFEF
jgi:hypothetical protein